MYLINVFKLIHVIQFNIFQLLAKIVILIVILAMNQHLVIAYHVIMENILVAINV